MMTTQSLASVQSMGLILIVALCLSAVMSVVTYAQQGADGLDWRKEVHPRLTPDMAFYPLLPDSQKQQAPALALRSPRYAGLGADVHGWWDEQNVHLRFDVIDPSEGPFMRGNGMWKADSVRLAIGQPEAKFAMDQIPEIFEMGFVTIADGDIDVKVWDGPIQEKMIAKRGQRRGSNWDVTVGLPWKALGYDQLPQEVLINVVVTDGFDNTPARHAYYWTPGFENFNNPEEYARFVRVKQGASSAAVLRFGKPTQVDMQFTLPTRYIEYALEDRPATTLTLTAAAGDKGNPATYQTKLPAISAGQVRIVSVDLPADWLSEKDVQFEAGLGDEQRVVAQHNLRVAKMYYRIYTEQKQVEQRARRLAQQVEASPELRENPYIKLGLNLVERFSHRIQTGGPSGDQPPNWSLWQVEELEEVITVTEDMLAHMRKTGWRPAVPRPTMDPVEIRDGLFYVKTTLEGDGRDDGPKVRPYFFGGWNSFGSAQEQMDEMWNYGTTVLSGGAPRLKDLDPGYTMPEQAIDRGKLELQRAAENRIRIDWSISPHVFPEWVMKANPILKYEGLGSHFLKYYINHPVARKTIETALEQSLPKLADYPAMFTINLANEPVWRHSGRREWTRPEWAQFLKDTHGSIDKLNELYGTHYKSFENVDTPPARSMTELNDRRQHYDWVVFNAKHFAEWFGWLDSLVKKYAPGTPTHVKIMQEYFRPDRIERGIDAELVCAKTDIAGMDFGAGGDANLDEGAFAQTSGHFPAETNPAYPYVYKWVWQAMAYDLLHSFKGQPVFNSENHIMGDPDGRWPAAHTRAILWQGGLHHLGATTCWIFTEPQGPATRNSVYIRPANIQAAARAWFDLNRLSSEVEAINKAKPEIAVLFSQTSLFWDDDMLGAMRASYAAMAQMGVPLTFVSERQLAEGRLPDVRAIVLPSASHIKPEALAGFEKFMDQGGQLIAIGDDNLQYDQYSRKLGKPADTIRSNMLMVSAENDERRLGDPLRAVLKKVGVVLYPIIDVTNGDHAFGVKYRVVEHDGAVLIPVMNVGRKTITIKLPVQGEAMDLLAHQSIDTRATKLEPMQPMLIRVESP